MNVLLPIPPVGRLAGAALACVLCLSPGGLSAEATPVLPDEAPPATRVPDTGRTLVLLGIGVVAASWAHRKSSLERTSAARKR